MWGLVFIKGVPFRPLVLQGNPYRRERISTVDLLVPTCSHQCLLILNYIFLFYKTTYFNEEVECNEPTPSVSVPWYYANVGNAQKHFGYNFYLVFFCLFFYTPWLVFYV